MRQPLALDRDAGRGQNFAELRAGHEVAACQRLAEEVRGSGDGACVELEGALPAGKARHHPR